MTFHFFACSADKDTSTVSYSDTDAYFLYAGINQHTNSSVEKMRRNGVGFREHLSQHFGGVTEAVIYFALSHARQSRAQAYQSQ